MTLVTALNYSLAGKNKPTRKFYWKVFRSRCVGVDAYQADPQEETR